MAGAEAGVGAAEFEPAPSAAEAVHAPASSRAKAGNQRIYEELKLALGREPTRREFAEAAGVSRQRAHQLRERFRFARGLAGPESVAAQGRLAAAAEELRSAGLTLTTQRLMDRAGVSWNVARRWAKAAGVGLVRCSKPERRELLTAKHKELMNALGRLPRVTEFVEAVWGPGANTGRVVLARKYGLEFQRRG